MLVMGTIGVPLTAVGVGGSLPTWLAIAATLAGVALLMGGPAVAGWRLPGGGAVWGLLVVTPAYLWLTAASGFLDGTSASEFVVTLPATVLVWSAGFLASRLRSRKDAAIPGRPRQDCGNDMPLLRRIAVGAGIGGGVTLVANLLTHGTVRALDAAFGATGGGEAIGVGLLMIAFMAASIPLGIWLGLRRCNIPGAAIIGALALPFYWHALIFTALTITPPPGGIIAMTLATAAYTAIGVWIAELVSSRRHKQAS